MNDSIDSTIVEFVIQLTQLQIKINLIRFN